MRGSAKQFIRRRSDPLAVTNSRVKEVVIYFILCYKKLLLDSPKYSKQWIKENTAHTVEDFLKIRFVDEYLIVNKDYFQRNVSALEQINFSYETQKLYQDSANRERVDKIDVYINKLGLQEVWQTQDEHLYLAIECKRIGKLSDNEESLGDIRKFCSRKYKHLRLPFEGMLSFVENQQLTSDQIVINLNERLSNASDIITLQALTKVNLSNDFDNSYYSKHKRITKAIDFGIYHLYFDYSKIVLS